MLDFTNVVEHHTGFGEYMIVVFLEVGKAYDCAGADIALSSLRAMSIRDRPVRLLSMYPQSRPIRVKLSSTVSSSRLLHAGWPQRRVLRTLVFNGSMPSGAARILCGHLCQ